MAPFALPRRMAAPARAAGAPAKAPDTTAREAATEEEPAGGVAQAIAAAEVNARGAREAAPTAAEEIDEVAPSLAQQAAGQQHSGSAAGQQHAPGRLAARHTPVTAPLPACQPPPPAGSPEMERSAAGPAQEQQSPAARQVPPVGPAEQAAPAATPLTAQRPPDQEAGAADETPAATPPARPLSAAKPVSRSQLRQQLLQSQRAAGTGAASPTLRSAVRGDAATPPSAAPRNTRGQRLLGLARSRKPLPAHAAAAEGALPACAAPQAVLAEHAEHAAAVEEGEQMQLDQPDGSAAVHAEQPSMPLAQPAQRRLTQSPLRRAPLPDGSTAQPGASLADGDAGTPVAASCLPEAAASPEPSPADGSAAATPPPRRSSPPTPLMADPGSTPRPALGCAAGLPGASPVSPVAEATGQQPCSSVQCAAANERAVQAALRQVGPSRGAARWHSSAPAARPCVCVCLYRAALACGQLHKD